MHVRIFKTFFCVVFFFVTPFCSLRPTHEFSAGGGNSFVQNVAEASIFLSIVQGISGWLFGSSQDSSIDIWGLLPESGHMYKPVSAFDAENAGDPDAIDKLTDFYNGLNDFEQKCAPFYVDYFGDVCVRSSGEIIRNFCGCSRKYLDYVCWDNTQASLGMISHLESKIYHTHKFRKRRVRPLEEKFDEKWYIRKNIEQYRGVLLAREIAEKKQAEQEKVRQEELAKQAELEQTRLEQARLEQARLEQERQAELARQAEQTRLEQAYLDRQQAWSEEIKSRSDASRSAIKNNAIESDLETLQNYKEMATAIKNKRSRGGFEEKKYVADYVVDQVEILEKQLENGGNFKLNDERIRAGIRTLQERGKKETRTYSFGERQGNALQHQAFSESCQMLKTCSRSKHVFYENDCIKNNFSISEKSAYASTIFTQAHSYENAYQLIDFGRASLLFAQRAGVLLLSIPEGIAQGVSRFSDNMRHMLDNFLDVALGYKAIGHFQCFICCSGEGAKCCPVCSGNTSSDALEKTLKISLRESWEETAAGWERMVTYAKQCVYDPAGALKTATSRITVVALNVLTWNAAAAQIALALESASLTAASLNTPRGPDLTISGGGAVAVEVAGVETGAVDLSSAIDVGRVAVAGASLMSGGDVGGGEVNWRFSQTKSETKWNNQMLERGWSESEVSEVINDPFTTRKSINRATQNDATVFYNKDGSYVIMDDVTSELIQVSHKCKAWVPDVDIVDPYIP